LIDSSISFRILRYEKRGQEIMRNLIMAGLLVLFSISGVASAAEDDVFVIEAEGRYRMEAGSSVDLAKKVHEHDFDLSIID